MAFGRLPRRAAAPMMAEINITPLVDVMLVLVVIFILSAPLLASAIRLELPRSGAVASSSTAPPKRLLQLELDRAGQAVLDGTPLSLPALATRLVEIATTAPDAEIQLRADAAVPYGKVVALMELAQQAGLSRIAFVTQAPF